MEHERIEQIERIRNALTVIRLQAQIARRRNADAFVLDRRDLDRRLGAIEDATHTAARALDPGPDGPPTRPVTGVTRRH